MSRRRQYRKFSEKRPNFDPRSAGCKCDSCPLGGAGKEIKCAMPPRSGENKLLVLEDFPFKQEIFTGRKNRNSNRAFVEHCFKGAGVRNYDFNWALLCRPETSDPKVLKAAIQACSGHLQGLRNTHALAAGTLSFAALTGHESPTAWLGTPTDAQERALAGSAVVVPTHTPWLVRTKAGAHLAGQFLGHVDRVARLSDGRLKEFKWPRIEINPTKEHITEFGSIPPGEIGVDLETRSNLEISCLALAHEELVLCFQYPFSPDARHCIQAALKQPHNTTITQNGPHFDHRVLRTHGFELNDKWDDTLLAAAILDPQLAKNLGALVSNEFHAPAHKAEFKLDEETGRLMGDWDSRNPEVERKRRIYCAKDAWSTLMLWKVQEERLEKYA